MPYAYSTNPDGSLSIRAISASETLVSGETFSDTFPDNPVWDAKQAGLALLASEWQTRSTTVGVTVSGFPFPFDLVTQQKVAMKLAVAQSGSSPANLHVRDLNGTVHTLTPANAVTLAQSYLNLCDLQNVGYQQAIDNVNAATTAAAATAAAAAW